MSSSEDDIPLSRANGRGKHLPNVTPLAYAPLRLLFLLRQFTSILTAYHYLIFLSLVRIIPAHHLPFVSHLDHFINLS